MAKEQHLSSYQFLCLTLLFLMGSTTVLQTITAAGRDTWISTLLGTGAGGLAILWMTFLAGRFPGKSLIEYGQILLGKWPGKLLGILYLWYFLHLGALVLRNYGEFLSTVVYPESEAPLFHITMGLAIAFMVYKGIEVTARTGEIVLPIFMAIFSFTTFVSFFSGSADLQNLKPILENGFKKLLLGTVPIAAFPFQELVVFSMIIPYLNKQKDGPKIMFAGLGLAGFILTMTMIQSIAVLGTYMSTLIFPRFFVIRLIAVGEFVQRIEPIIITAWILGGIIKLGICLHAFVEGTGQLLGIKEYKILVAPFTFILIALTNSLFKNVGEMLNFAANIYPVYAFPFQIAFPFLLVILALVKGTGNKNTNKKQGKNNTNRTQANNNNNNNNNNKGCS